MYKIKPFKNNVNINVTVAVGFFKTTYNIFLSLNINSSQTVWNIVRHPINAINANYQAYIHP